MSSEATPSVLTDLPIRSPWFEAREVGEGITLIVEPAVHRFLRCNIWYVRGRDRDMIVDTGMGIVPLRDELDRHFRSELLAVATHFHGDHVGGLGEFDARAISEHDRALLEAHDPGTDSLRVGDIPPEALAKIRAAGYEIDDELFISALPVAGYSPSDYRVAATTATLTLRDGDVIDLGDRRFEVIPLPGHTPGSIGLWESDTGILFSGDAVYDGPLLDFGSDSDVPTYVRTMRRLQELPVRTVHAGHDPSFDAPRLHHLINAYLESRA